MRRTWSLAAATCALVLVAGCGSAEPAPAAASAVAVTGGQLTVVAKDLALAPAAIQTTSDIALTVDFQNQDNAVPHDLVLSAGPGDGVKLASTEVFSGVASRQFAVPPLVPGQYRFSCTVHPNMSANLTVTGPS